jgi:hypothetical protein
MTFCMKSSSHLALCALVFLVASAFVGCEKIEDPKHPPNIDANAQWAGGSDGGHWISCRAMSVGEYFCRISHVDGSEADAGIFEGPKFDPNQDGVYLGTGDLHSHENKFRTTVLLKNGSTLIAKRLEP